MLLGQVLTCVEFTSILVDSFAKFVCNLRQRSDFKSLTRQSNI